MSATTELGIAYFKGKHGLDKDYAEAFPLFKKAAKAGCHAAAVRAGIMVMKGMGVARDDIYGMQLFFLAAVLGSEHACEHVGHSYAEGINGYIKDDEEAMFWHLKMRECPHQDSVAVSRKRAENFFLGVLAAAAAAVPSGAAAPLEVAGQPQPPRHQRRCDHRGLPPRAVYDYARSELRRAAGALHKGLSCSQRDCDLPTASGQLSRRVSRPRPLGADQSSGQSPGDHQCVCAVLGAAVQRRGGHAHAYSRAGWLPKPKPAAAHATAALALAAATLALGTASGSRL